jgi:GTP cyclohydrolase I
LAQSNDTKKEAPNVERLTELYGEVLSALGEDPQREGLLKTPRRVAEAMAFLTQGYHQNVEDIINGAVFEEAYDEIVVVKDIEFFSTCEHHVLPFFGSCHVAYLPKGKIIGLSKIPRIVDMFARRLQVQERMTNEIAFAIQDAIQPRGVAVVAEARHLCMIARGVEKQHSKVVTSAMLGGFRSNRATREEFLNLIRGRK